MFVYDEIKDFNYVHDHRYQSAVDFLQVTIKQWFSRRTYAKSATTASIQACQVYKSLGFTFDNENGSIEQTIVDKYKLKLIFM